MMGHLETMGVPQDCVKFFEARYWKDYESVDAIIDAAVADGFPDFDMYRSIIRPTDFTIICTWNWACMLREIIESNEISLILLDDNFLSIDFELLRDNVTFLNENPPFHILQLAWWSTTVVNSRLYQDGEIINGFIGTGTKGNGDWGTVVSPTGAKWILEDILKVGTGTEGLFCKWAQPEHYKPGIFHFIESKLEGPNVSWEQDLEH